MAKGLCGMGKRLCGMGKGLCGMGKGLCGMDKRLCGMDKGLSGMGKGLCGMDKRPNGWFEILTRMGNSFEICHLWCRVPARGRFHGRCNSPARAVAVFTKTAWPSSSLVRPSGRLHRCA